MRQIYLQEGDINRAITHSRNMRELSQEKYMTNGYILIPSEFAITKSVLVGAKLGNSLAITIKFDQTMIVFHLNTDCDFNISKILTDKNLAELSNNIDVSLIADFGDSPEVEIKIKKLITDITEDLKLWVGTSNIEMNIKDIINVTSLINKAFLTNNAGIIMNIFPGAEDKGEYRDRIVFGVLCPNLNSDKKVILHEAFTVEGDTVSFTEIEPLRSQITYLIEQVLNPVEEMSIPFLDQSFNDLITKDPSILSEYERRAVEYFWDVLGVDGEEVGDESSELIIDIVETQVTQTISDFKKNKLSFSDLMIENRDILLTAGWVIDLKNNKTRMEDILYRMSSEKIIKFTRDFIAFHDLAGESSIGDKKNVLHQIDILINKYNSIIVDSIITTQEFDASILNLFNFSQLRGFYLTINKVKMADLSDKQKNIINNFKHKLLDYITNLISIDGKYNNKDISEIDIIELIKIKDFYKILPHISSEKNISKVNNFITKSTKMITDAIPDSDVTSGALEYNG